MKKKIAVIILTSMTMVVIAAFCFIKFRTPVIVQSVDEYKYLSDSTEELKGMSDYIVVATPRKVKNSPEHVEEIGLVAGCTYTDLNVEQVIKGDLEPGSVLPIMEDYYTTDWGKYLYPTNGYVPMKKGQKYLLFLKYDDAVNEYRVFDLNYSKFVVFEDRASDSFSEKDREILQVGDLTDMKKYLAWYKDIMGEYYSTGTLEWTDIPEDDEDNYADMNSAVDEVMLEGYSPFVETISEKGYTLEASSTYNILDGSNYSVRYEYGLIKDDEKLGSLCVEVKNSSTVENLEVEGIFDNAYISKETILFYNDMIYLSDDFYTKTLDEF